MLLANAAPALAEYDAGVRAYTSGNFVQALAEFRESARRGHSGAEFMLGVQYFNGAGVEHDPATAAIYFHLAAEKGLPAAQLAFGSIHIRGVGVWQNLVRAHYWLTLAVESGDPDLKAEAVALRNATARLMTTDELTQAAELAAAWRPARTGLMRFDP
ncbi:MAG: tetratricopeptide repeat protein [Proteobacteria bacterium]|nr:tetratricopeptide repeat protein [Pseudomonadota bacterium]